MSNADHPAIKAATLSIKYASEGNREAWLDLYADDAIVKDPVGVSPFDPSGEGHQGKTAIAAFWDNVISQSKISMGADKRIVSGPRHCASLQWVANDLGDGKSTRNEMMATYEVNEEGKITQMFAHWDFDGLMEQLANQG